MSNFWTLSEKALYKLLNTDNNGLTKQEATKRLETYGENILPEAAKPSLLSRIVKQFADF